MAFKLASKKAQARLARKMIKVSGVSEDLTPEQYRDVLKGRKMYLEAKLADCTKEERPFIIAEKAAVDLELRETRIWPQFGRDFAHFLCDVIKPDVPKAQWDMWVNKAKILRQRQEEQLEKEFEIDIETYEPTGLVNPK